MKDFLQTYVLFLDEKDRRLRKQIQNSCLYKLIRLHAGKDLPEDTPIRFVQGPYGKPALEEPGNLHFNLSDSGPYTVIVLSSLPVGTDIEIIRPRTAARFPERWFAEEEISLAKDCPEESYSDPNAGFIRLWTCKESLLKQIGCGLCAEMRSHPVLSRCEKGKRIPYAMYLDTRLAFTSFLMKNGRTEDFSSRSARCGDYILCICHPEKFRGECPTPIFLPADFPFPKERNR